MACLWKQHLSYWRNPQHNAIRFFTTINFGLIFGTLFWNSANDISKQQDLLNIMGAMYASIFFLGGDNASAVQSVVSVERMVFYREKAAGMYSSIPYALAQLASRKILLVHILQLHLLPHLHIVWNDVARPHTRTSNVGLTHGFFLWLMELVLGLHCTKTNRAYLGEMVLLGIPSSLDDLWNHGVPIQRQRESVRDPRRSRVRVKVFQKGSYGYDYDFLKYVALVNTSFAIILSFYVPYQIP